MAQLYGSEFANVFERIDAYRMELMLPGNFAIYDRFYYWNLNV